VSKYIVYPPNLAPFPVKFVKDPGINPDGARDYKFTDTNLASFLSLNTYIMEFFFK
jgi:hypothetical protein